MARIQTHQNTLQQHSPIFSRGCKTATKSDIQQKNYIHPEGQLIFTLIKIQHFFEIIQ